MYAEFCFNRTILHVDFWYISIWVAGDGSMSIHYTFQIFIEMLLLHLHVPNRHSNHEMTRKKGECAPMRCTEIYDSVNQLFFENVAFDQVLKCNCQCV